MKRTLLLALILLVFSCTEKPEPVYQPGERITSFELLKTQFKDPPIEYRTAPFWVWNNDVSKHDIDRTLLQFKEKGIGGVFIHPRYGLITEYLSDEWWELIDYSLKKAEELDLKLWIYDENSFPSGFAGGHVAAQMPEANSEGIALMPHYLKKLDIPQGLERITHIFMKEGNDWKEITEDALNYRGNSGEFCVLDLNDFETSKWFGGYSYVDLIKPGVTEKFIEITMPGYEKTLGEEFGKRVPGVFTDEPNVNTRRAGPIRYTPDLYEQFEKQWGYQLEPHLMSLITETGDWKKVRHNYQSTILQLFVDRWAKPWYEYTEDKNLAWTGHYWEHGWPNPKHGGDNMAMYAWHQVPGVDMLFNSEKERPDQFGNVRAVKELSSVVNQFDRHRALSETYGAAGWELTFEDMKRLGDWEYVLGVNLMNQHLSYISLAGDRKHDFPQSFGTYSPYWGVFRYHADYFARLSLALSSGHQKNNILVLEPTSTTWMYYNPTDDENAKMNSIGDEFEKFLTSLERFQVEYDLGCENIIKDHGRINDGKFVIYKADYDLIIIPPGTENLDGPTFKLLKQYSEAGGKVLQVDANLQFVDGETSTYTELQNSVNWSVIPSANRTFFSELAENEKIIFENPADLQGRIFHQRREFEDGQLLFITNFDQSEKSTVKLSMPGKSVTELDATSGEITPYYFDRKRGNVNFEVMLHPAGSKLLFISDERLKSGEKPEFTREEFEAGSTEIQRIAPNILNLDYVELTMDKFRNEPMYFYTAANEIWKQHGYPDNPWVSSSQFKTELVDANNFEKGTGFKVTYPFEVAEELESENVQLVVERPWLYSVKVNGTEVEALEWERWLDDDFHVFEIGELLESGRNDVQIEANPFSIFAELEPVYLLGDFNTVPAEQGFKIEKEKGLKLGSWKNQGLPFYGQTVAYKKEFDVKVESEFLIKLPDWNGTVAEILIDGEHAGIIQSQPYEFRFKLPYGNHSVQVVVNGSLKNTLGPHHNVTRRGIVTPWSFKYAPEVQPPGEAYDLLDYGLFQDFQVYRLR